MLSLKGIREKFGAPIIGTIIALIASVFVFYGVFNPRATRGIHSGSVAGTVNGDPITLKEFRSELAQRVEFFKNMMGGKVSEEALKGFGIYNSVFDQLVTRKLMVQEATRQGRTASDEEVKSRIEQMPAFQNNGKFDLSRYKMVLEANDLSPGAFERIMREDLSSQHWQSFFRDRSLVSEEEIRRQFLVSNDKRNVKFVLLTSENGKKAVSIAPEEIKKFLADAGKANIAKNQFEARKQTEFKGKNFDDVKESIAKSILASEKTDEIRKSNEKIADQVLPLLTADKGSDSKINAILKPYGGEVKTTGMISRLNPALPGIGEARDLMNDLFAKKSPIDPTQGGKAKKYTSAGWILVAIGAGSEKPDLSKLEKERSQVTEQVVSAKERALFTAWIRHLKEKASVEKNPEVVGGGGGGADQDG